MRELATRVRDLKARALAMEVEPLPFTQVSNDMARLRIGAECAAPVTALGFDGARAAFEDSWDPSVLQALEHLGLTDRWDPTSLYRSLTWINESQQRGLVNTLKGAMFEYQVMELSESGDLALPHHADELRLAEGLTQPGWDAQLLKDGEPVGLVQMKATTDLSQIREHMERYPDVPDVVTTSEVAQDAAASGITVIDSGILDSDLTELAETATDSLDFSSAVGEVVPGSAAAVILVLAGLRIRHGEPAHLAKEWAKGELVSVGAAHLVGLAVEVGTGVAVLRPITSITTKLAVRRARVAVRARDHLRKIKNQLAELRRHAEAVTV